MQKFPALLFLLVCLSYTVVHAQTYELNVSSEPFAFLENPEPAYVGAWDLPEYEVPLGFDFQFFDITSNRLYCFENSWGGLFGLNTDMEHYYTLIPFYAALTDRGSQQDSALSPINYKTEGEAGQRVFTLEYVEAGLFFGIEDEDAIFQDHISFQVKLYEATGDIVFHYGPYSIQEDPEIVFDPYPGPIVGLMADVDNSFGGEFGELILLSGDAADPTVVTDEITVLTWPIPENTIYRFSRIPNAVVDATVDVLQPCLVPNPSDGELNLHGMDAQDIIFPITVLDLQGRVVDTWEGEAEITAIDLPTGSYCAVIKTKAKVIVEKLVRL